MPDPYIVQFSSCFAKDIKKLEEQRYDLHKLTDLIHLLINKKTLSAKYKDHDLHGRLKGYRDAHVDNPQDWILLYRYVGHNKIRFERTGTHRELFQDYKK